MSEVIDTGVELRRVSAATPGLTSKRVPFTEIPVIDFSAMAGDDAEAQAELSREIDVACTDVGFFYVSNHGVPAAVTEALFAASRWFFAQNLDTKLAIDISRSSVNRGYIPMFGEKNNSKSQGDVKETFDMAIEIGPDDPDYLAGNPLYGPNQWPAGAPHFQEALNQFFKAITGLSRRMYRAFALGLGLPEGHFLGMLDKPLDILRLLRYPPQPVVESEDRIGTGAHSDFDCFTLLYQDPTGGLQVLNGAGEWIDAPPIENTFLVNVGDMLERWTNARYVSTVHRVINRSEGERFSCVFFAAPSYSTVVECLPGCCSADVPAKFPPIGAGDYIIERYNEILVQGGR